MEELNNRFNVLIQAAQIAQTKGVLSLDDAVYVKKAIDSVKAGENLDIAAKILIKTAQVAQSKGVYSLKDAYVIYIASEGLEAKIPQELQVDAQSEETNE